TAYSAISCNGHRSSSLEISMVIKAMINQNNRATSGTLAGRINGNRSHMGSLFSSLVCLEPPVAWHNESSITSQVTIHMQELYEDRASSTFPVINCGIIELRANRGIETCVRAKDFHHSHFTFLKPIVSHLPAMKNKPEFPQGQSF